MKGKINAKYRNVSLFIFMTLSVSWIFFFSCLFFLGKASRWLVLVSAVYSFIPLVIAFLFQKKFYADRPIKKELALFFRFNKWFAIGAITAIITVFATVGGSFFFSSSMQWNHSLLSSPGFIGVMVGTFVGMLFGIMYLLIQEVVWRGFMIKELSSLHFITKSLLIGIVFSLWQLPIFIYFTLSAYSLMTILLTSVSSIVCCFWANYLRLKSGSILPSSIFYGVFSALLTAFLLTLNATNLPPSSNFIEIVTVVTLGVEFLLFIVVLFLYDRFIAKEKLIFVKIKK